ncbi:MAG TPA: TIGR02466 family protein [Vineibacter sp.]|nr:TIGR02466 family protein [Vineibacter sp.]
MSSSTAAAKVEVAPLFATPVAVVDVPDAVALNAALKRVILDQEKASPGTQHSNLGGWQSSWDMERWGGAPAARLLDVARGVVNGLTCDRQGRAVTIAWKANIWANVNRAGHGNEFHFHPGSFWSGVYYVEDGGIGADPSLGGELEFMDPRGATPAMYAPHLAWTVPGGRSMGACETIPPRAGRMVLFPAWMLHAVRPYRGAAERISIAFNLSL